MPSITPLHPDSRKGLSFDAVFIHGLNSNGTDAWAPGPGAEPFWPYWLAEDFPNFGIWAVSYEAAASAWTGTNLPMSMYDRSKNLLALLRGYGIGQRPLCFITHSMGGLIAKQMLRYALEESSGEFKAIADAVRGIVFIATPHLGSGVASLLDYFRFFLRRTVATRELQENESFLLSLRDWYRNQAGKLGTETLAFAETQPTFGVMVVNAASAEPGIGGAIPVDANHISISKPKSKDSLLYRNVAWFLRSLAAKQLQPREEYDTYVQELNAALLKQYPMSPFYFPLTMSLKESSADADQPREVKTDGSLTTILRVERRIHLRGAAGAGKSAIVSRLARELCSHQQVPIFLSLKSWKTQDSEDLDRIDIRQVDDRFDYLMSHSIIDVTSGRLGHLPPAAQRVIVVDGLNEVYLNGRSVIVRTLDRWLTNHYAEHPAVIVTDRLGSPELFGGKWLHYDVQPLPGEVVKDQIEVYLPGAGDYDKVSKVDKELLSSPYFLSSVFHSGRLALGSAANAIRAFFTLEIKLTASELSQLAKASFDALNDSRSLSFPQEWMQQRIGAPLLSKLMEDGILVGSGRQDETGGESLHFDHQLKHDYLVASELANDAHKWNSDVFDSITFKQLALSGLAMTLQELPTAEQGDRFLRAVYDWSWPGALTCLAQAARTGKVAASKEVEWMLLGLLAEKLLDPIAAARNSAARIFGFFAEPPGSELRMVASWNDVRTVVGNLSSHDELFQRWRSLFLKQGSICEEEILVITEPDPILGWTVANLLRRLDLTEGDLRQLRQILRDDADATIRWRVSHALGQFPTAAKAGLLLKTVEKDPAEWVRYGAARAALEIAARTQEPLIRSSILVKLSQAGPESPDSVKREIRRALYTASAPDDWGQAVQPLLSAIKASLPPTDILSEAYSRAIHDFSTNPRPVSPDEYD